MIPGPLLARETDLLAEIVVAMLAVRSAAEEGQGVVDVRVVDLDRHIAVREERSVSAMEERRRDRDSLDPRLNPISVPFREEG